MILVLFTVFFDIIILRRIALRRRFPIGGRTEVARTPEPERQLDRLRCRVFTSGPCFVQQQQHK